MCCYPTILSFPHPSKPLDVQNPFYQQKEEILKCSSLSFPLINGFHTAPHFSILPFCHNFSEIQFLTVWLGLFSTCYDSSESIIIVFPICILIKKLAFQLNNRSIFLCYPSSSLSIREGLKTGEKRSGDCLS